MALGLVEAFVLAIVQGITAWIPVSSKTQVFLAGNAFFSLSFQTAIAFALILHIGDLIAALYRYRSEYSSAVASLAKPRRIFSFENPESSFLILSIIATAVVALPAYLLVKKIFSNLRGEWLLGAVGVLLIVMAVITWISHSRKNREENVSLKSSLLTGFAQGLAVIPGISRSGITQSALLLQGFEPEKAMRLSFLMSAPMIAAAFLAFYVIEGFSGFGLDVILLGIAVSALVSFLTMDFLTKIAKRIPTPVFLAGMGLLALVPLGISLLLHIFE